MAEMLSIRRKILSIHSYNQSINQSINQSMIVYWAVFRVSYTWIMRNVSPDNNNSKTCQGYNDNSLIPVKRFCYRIAQEIQNLLY